MQDALGPGTILGYCTNVHPGATLDAVLAELDRHAVKVKRLVSPDQPMGVGLWLSDHAAREAIENERVGELQRFLEKRGLQPYTLNGFPFGDFHEPVIKHKVYQPDWTTTDRYDHTLRLARILADLLPEGAEGSISTVPIGWPSGDEAMDEHRLDRAAERLTNLVHQLARLELETGRYIHVDLEPEPGCLLDTAGDVVRFFNEHLLSTLDDVSVLAYLRVCHDVCHSAVMFEPQHEALAAYEAAGIKVGKVQLSNALRVRFDRMTSDTWRDAQAALQRFAEDRYLHQTSVRLEDGRVLFYEDLCDAIAAHPQPEGEWRVHFHVPIGADSFGPLATTHHELAACLDSLTDAHECHHFEAETYAWSVLPEELRPGELAEGIAMELQAIRRTVGAGA